MAIPSFPLNQILEEAGTVLASSNNKIFNGKQGQTRRFLVLQSNLILLPRWRNWYTRRSQKPMVETS